MDRAFHILNANRDTEISTITNVTHIKGGGVSKGHIRPINTELSADSEILGYATVSLLTWAQHIASDKDPQ